MNGMWVAAAFICCVAIGTACTPPEPALSEDCLTLDEVLATADAAGDATGSGFSGEYKSTSILMTSCVQCSLNTQPDSMCVDVFLVEGIVTIMQEGGRITLDDETNIVTGAMNADGTFTLGTVIPATRDDGVETGRILVFTEGTFVGSRIIGTMTLRATVNVPDGSVIDLQWTNSVTWERVD